MKQYSFIQKLVSFLLMFSIPISAIFAIALVVSGVESVEISDYDYEDLHTFEIVGHSVEKINNNECIITLNLKNDSAYTAELSDYDFDVKVGDELDRDACVEIFDTNLNYNRQELIVPAGRTVDAHFYIKVKNSMSSVIFSYRGTSYGYKNIFGEEKDKTYLVDVDLR